MTVLGNWTLTMNTPMGVQTSKLSVTQTAETFAATMTGPDGETQPATDLKVDGDKVTWKVAVKKPIPLTLHFDVSVDGDALSGKFRPGMFPPSPVTGVRS